MKPRRINMRDIAREAGVSLGTVSLALRGHPSISEGTRERIRGVAERLGYRPNARVAELMGEIRRNRGVEGVAESAAMVWSDVTREMLKRYAHLEECEEAARLELERHGFGLNCFYSDDIRVERVLQARGIRGVLLAPLVRLPHRHLRWKWDRFSAVILGSSLWKPEFHRVRFNHFEEMGLILHHLRHRGLNKKVGFIVADAIDARSQRALSGGFFAHSRAFASSRIFFSKEDDRAGLLRWVRSFRPDYLIVQNTVEMDWVLEGGVESEIVLTSQCFHPAALHYAGIRQNYAHLGQVAAQQLVAQLMLNDCGVPKIPRKIFIMGTWVDRKKI